MASSLIISAGGKKKLHMFSSLTLFFYVVLDYVTLIYGFCLSMCVRLHLSPASVHAVNLLKTLRTITMQ